MKHRLDYSDKKVTIKKKSVINAHLIQEYSIFSEVDWGSLYLASKPNNTYEYFLKVSQIYTTLHSFSKLSRFKGNSAKSLDDQIPLKIV